MERRGGLSPSRLERLSAYWLHDLRRRATQPVEAITLAGHGDDQARLLRIGLDLAAQFPYQHVDAAVERLETPFGEGVQQSVAADHPSGPGDEHPQQSELPARQRDRLAGLAGEHAGLEIEHEAREAQRWV